jgi:MtN3 and saliva related transmembrane protein
MLIVAYLAGFFTLIGYLPQTIKTIRLGETKDLSIPTFLIIGTSAVLWTTYGLGSHNPAIWVTNSVVAICSLTITTLAIRQR